MSTQTEINEFRKLQENTQTPGPKCNRCFFDIIWDKPTSERLFGPGKNRPFEVNNSTGHTCPIDQQNNYMTRPGYTKDNVTAKVIWIGGGGGQTQLPYQPQQQPQQYGQAPPADISAQLGGLTNSIKQLAAAYEAVAMKQNDEINRLAIIIDEHIRHNPLESSYLELTKMIINKISKDDLGPRTADQYKVGFEST